GRRPVVVHRRALRVHDGVAGNEPLRADRAGLLLRARPDARPGQADPGRVRARQQRPDAVSGTGRSLIMTVAMSPSPTLMPPLLKAMRPKQWIKNLLLFAGFVFTLNERWRPFSPEMWDYLERSAAAFLLFAMLSSSVYMINDVIDVEKDRLHTTKRNRPIASGALSTKTAIVFGIVLLVVSFGG